MNGNQSAEEDFRIPDALEALFRNQEQTYEEFLNAFTTLTAEDVAAYQLRVASRSNSSSIPAQDTENSRTTAAPPTDDRVQAAGYSEDLQEEMLEEGTRAPTFLMRTAETTGGTLLKVDNFVEDEGLGSSSEDGDSANSDSETTYQPSCLSATKQETEPVATKAMETNAEKQLCRIPNENQSVSSQTTSYQSDSKNSESEDFARIPNVSKDLNFDPSLDANAVDCDDGLDAGRNLERNEFSGDEIAEQCKVTQLPGETEDIPESPKECQIKNDTLLEMASTSKSSRETTHKNIKVMDELSSDEVQPFTLDEDFDYDNVTLTPKWEMDNHPPGWREGH